MGNRPPDWTDAELAALRVLRDEGRTDIEIGLKLGRARYAVRDMRRKLQRDADVKAGVVRPTYDSKYDEQAMRRATDGFVRAFCKPRATASG